MTITDKIGGHPDCRIVVAVTETHFTEAATLFREYADSLDFALDFQDFESELTRLAVMYGPPDGCLILARVHGAVAGCVALRKFRSEICEMKRLYVRPSFRKAGLGRILAQEIIHAARCAGYRRMRLDTVASMQAATALYKSLGFVQIDPYRHNPVEGARFYEFTL